MRVLEKINLRFSHDEIFVKDMELSFFNKKFPKFSKLTKHMRKNLPDGFTFYLVDLVVQDQKPGMNTCRDVRWHIDGDYDKDNQYVLWVSGPNRTLFPKTIPVLADMPQDRNDQNNYIEMVMKDEESFEIPEQTLIQYDSQTPHKGVVCQKEGKRFFVRMMATNYIKPKFMVKEKIHAQL